MMSRMTAAIASSSADSAGTMPSPLSFVAVKIASVLETSAREIAFASAFPRFLRMSLALARTSLPVAVSVEIESSGTSSTGLWRSPRSFTTSFSHLMAPSTSGGRMRPSPSASRSFNVRASISVPLTGHDSATQSF